MLSLEARRVIRASPERVFSHIQRGEHLPRYATPLWMAADQVEKRGGTQVVTLRGYFAGLPVESVQRLLLRPPSLEFTQIRGTLRALSGRVTLRSVEDGAEVLFKMDVDPAISMITEDAARQFLVQVMERMLDRIKLAAERKAPSRSRSPVRASEAALTETDDEDAEEAPEPHAPEPHLPEPHLPEPHAPEPHGPVPYTGPEVAAIEAPIPLASTPATSAPASSADVRDAAQVPPASGPGPRPGGRRRRRHRRRRRPGDARGPSPPTPTP